MRIELNNVTKRYGDHRALDDLSIVVDGEVKTLVFIGPSGGGKSTLLRLLGGLETPDEGTVAVGESALPDTEAELQNYRRGNGYLFQAFNLFPHLTLRENIMLPLKEVHGWDEGTSSERSDECLERLGLAGHGSKTPGQLSGGQQQRGALARAIAARPRLLILDEPTSALDPEMTAEVLAVIEELCAAGQEIIMSTHEMGFAKAVADHAVFLADGLIVEEGPQIFGSAKEEAVQRFLSRVMRY